MHPIESRILEIKSEVQELRNRIVELDSLLPGLEEALRIGGKSYASISAVQKVEKVNPPVSLDNMRRGTRTMKVLETLNKSEKPMRPQAIADVLEYPSSKAVRTLLHLAKGKGLVTPSGNRSYVISELGKELLKKKVA
jgi:hypothetical protein